MKKISIGRVLPLILFGWEEKMREKNEKKKNKKNIYLFKCIENERKEKFILYKMTYISLININIF